MPRFTWLSSKLKLASDSGKTPLGRLRGAPTAGFFGCLTLGLIVALVLFATAPVHGQAAGEVPVYQESFDDEEAQGWSLGRGWIVKGGQLNTSGYGVAYLTRDDWGYPDITFSFRLRALFGELFFSAASSPTSYFDIHLRSQGDLLTLVLFKDYLHGTSYSEPATATFPYNARVSYIIETVIAGEQIQVYVREEGKEGISAKPVIDYVGSERLVPNIINLKSPDTTKTVAVDDITVTGLAPDLVVSVMSSRFEADSEILVLALEVINKGTITSDGTSVTVRDVLPIPVLTHPVPALGEGEAAQLEVREHIPGEWRGQTHTFSISIDPDDNVRESNEKNNQQTVAVEVPALPRGIIWWWGILPAAALAIGLGASLRARTNRLRLNRVKASPQSDAGTQLIDRSPTSLLKPGLRLKAVSDPGKQDIVSRRPLIDRRGEKRG